MMFSLAAEISMKFFKKWFRYDLGLAMISNSSEEKIPGIQFFLETNCHDAM